LKNGLVQHALFERFNVDGDVRKFRHNNFFYREEPTAAKPHKKLKLGIHHRDAEYTEIF